MRLADQWRAIESELPAGWGDTHLRLQVSDPSRSTRAAALLGPLNPVRRRSTFDLHATRTNASLVRRLLSRVDAEGVVGTLELHHVDEPAGAVARAQRSVVTEWDEQLGALPEDWSDVYAELELDSSDHLPRAALLLAPVNPARHGDTRALRFRVARRFGYGASAEMTRRCFERLDEERITGSVRVLHALSDTNPVATQGPVWYVEGKAV